MMQIKVNFNNFIFRGVSAAAWQRASGIRRRRWRLWLAYPIMTSFRYVPYVSSVTSLTFRALRWMEPPHISVQSRVTIETRLTSVYHTHVPSGTRRRSQSCNKYSYIGLRFNTCFNPRYTRPMHSRPWWNGHIYCLITYHY